MQALTGGWTVRAARVEADEWNAPCLDAGWPAHDDRPVCRRGCLRSAGFQGEGELRQARLRSVLLRAPPPAVPSPGEKLHGWGRRAGPRANPTIAASALGPLTVLPARSVEAGKWTRYEGGTSAADHRAESGEEVAPKRGWCG